MSDDLIQAIKEQVTCQAFAEKLGLHPDQRGWCVCPLHNEKTASMRVYPNNRGWYCFGCNRGGDVISLAKAVYKTDFPGAVRQLAHDFDIPTREDARRTPQEALRAAVERAKVKSLVEKQKRLREAVEADYWRCLDKWFAAEAKVRDLEPTDRDEPFSWTFAAAVIARDYARESLEIAEQRRREIINAE